MLPPSLSSRRGRIRLLVILGTLSAFPPMSTDLYLPAFRDIAASLNTDVGAVQLTLAASFLGMGAGQLVYGPMSDRFGRRWPLTVGIVVFIVASFGCAFAPTLPVLVVLRLVQALGGSAGIVIGRAVVRDCYTGMAMARTLSAMMMVFALAPVLAPSLGAAILSVAPWPWLFVTLAGFGVLCLVGVLFLPETHPDHHRTDHGVRQAMGAYASIARRRDFAVPAAIAGLASVTLFAYIASSPAVMMDVYGLSAQQFALLFGVNSLFFVAGAQINMRLLRRFSVHRLLTALLGVQVVATLVLVGTTSAGLPIIFVLVPLACALAVFGGIASNAVTETLHPFARVAGSAAALVGMLQMGSGALVAALLAVLPLSPAVEMAVVMLLASSTGLILSLKRRPAAATSGPAIPDENDTRGGGSEYETEHRGERDLEAHAERAD